MASGIMSSTELPLFEARELQIRNSFASHAFEFTEFPHFTLHESVHGIVETTMGHVSVDGSRVDLRHHIFDDNDLRAWLEGGFEGGEDTPGASVGVIEEDLTEQVNVGGSGLGFEERMGLEANLIFGEFGVLGNDIVGVVDDFGEILDDAFHRGFGFDNGLADRAEGTTTVNESLASEFLPVVAVFDRLVTVGGSLSTHVTSELLALARVGFEVLIERHFTSIAEAGETFVGISAILDTDFAEIERGFGEMVKHDFHSTCHQRIEKPD